MKKVLILSGYHHEIPPTKGAAVQTWIYEVAKRLIMFETHVISKSHDFMPKKEFREGVFFHRIDFGRFYRIVFQKILDWDIYSYNDRIFKAIKTIRPDIIHIHNYYGIKNILPKIRKLDNNIKIILHMHNESKQFATNDFPFVDAFVGCSNFIVNSYKVNNYIQSHIFRTLYNGVDVAKFNSANKYKASIRNLTYRKTKNICYFGRVSSEKGVDKILEIANLLKNSQEFNFYIIGEIPAQGGRREYYNKLIEYKIQHNLNNVEFLDVIVPHKMHLAYQLADMVIIPSLFEEPFCMVAIESMASRVPTICAYKGGMKEYLVDNENSMIINDYENFSNIAVDKIQQYFSYHNNIIESACKMVEDRFDWMKIANMTEKLYNEALETKY